MTDVVEGGSSLAFEVFPVAFASLPAPHFWAVSFFHVTQALTTGQHTTSGIVHVHTK